MEPLRFSKDTSASQLLDLSISATSPYDGLLIQQLYRQPSTYMNRVAGVRKQVLAGEMPQVGNNYAFVIDRRPEGNEGGYIPADEYTRYFSQRRIPIADVDHQLYGHDTTHAPSYQTLFANARFADLVQVAATNALENPQLCETFTQAVDRFSDSVLDFEDGTAFREGDAYSALYAVDNAERHLRSLIELENRSLGADDDTTEQLHAQLVTQLGLNGYRARALAHQEAQNARTAHMTGSLGLNTTFQGDFISPMPQEGEVLLRSLPNL